MFFFFFKEQMKIITKDETKKIIELIQRAGDPYKEYCRKNGIDYHNAKHFDKWDNIFTSMHTEFSSDKYKVFSIKRGGLWNFAAIYNIERKILFLLMKEENFKKIQKKTGNLYHYLRIFNSRNDRFENEKYEQLAFIAEEKPNQEKIECELEKMIGEIKDKVDVCVNILFETREDKLHKIGCVLATSELNVVKEWNLSEFITANIDQIADVVADIDNDENDKPLIELPIRVDKIQREVVNPQIKDNEKDKQGGKQKTSEG